MKEKYPKSLTVLGVCGAFLLSGCVNPNYEGEGNDFTIQGPILDIGDNSVQILPVVVIDANGHAEGWFDPEDPTRVHDNYEDEWCTQQEVGKILDTSDRPIELDELQEGEWVEIAGNIREKIKIRVVKAQLGVNDQYLKKYAS